jgi:hypothetical protein
MILLAVSKAWFDACANQSIDRFSPLCWSLQFAVIYRPLLLNEIGAIARIVTVKTNSKACKYPQIERKTSMFSRLAAHGRNSLTC